MTIFSRDMALALAGELQADLDAADEAIMRAVRKALTNVVSEGKQRIRDQVVQAGLGKAGAGDGRGSGRSLASAVRYEIYPKSGLARNPAALLYIQPSAEHIFDAFEEGATISAKGGKFLTIPIPGSPASREVFGDKPRGQSVLEKLKTRGIEVEFIKATASRPAMLIAKGVRLSAAGKLSKVQRRGGKDGQTVNPRRKKAASYAKGEASVPLFFLLPKVRIAKRLNLNREFERAANAFFDDLSREIAAELARVEAMPTQRRAA